MRPPKLAERELRALLQHGSDREAEGTLGLWHAPSASASLAPAYVGLSVHLSHLRLFTAPPEPRAARTACPVATMPQLTHAEWGRVVTVAGIGTVLEW